MFIAPTIFGQVPTPNSNADYPNGYGVPNPVPSAYSTGPGTLLQCPKAFTVSDLAAQIWLTQARELYVKGSCSAADAVNFHGSSFSFEHLPSPVLPESPAPVLPHPDGSPFSGPVALATANGILSAAGTERAQVAQGIIGTVDLVTKVSDGSTRANMPLLATVYVRQRFDFYPWYKDAAYYCNLDLIFEVECQLEEAGYVGTPDVTISVPGWVTVYPDASGYRRSDLGELWGAGDPGTTSRRPGENNAQKLGEFTLVEQAAPTDPYSGQLNFERLALIVSTTYPARV